MKEWAPLVGKTKKSKSEDKFYSDDEDEKEEEGSESSGSADSSTESKMKMCFQNLKFGAEELMRTGLLEGALFQVRSTTFHVTCTHTHISAGQCGQ